MQTPDHLKHDTPEIRCLSCDYNLTHLPAGDCPECGNRLRKGTNICENCGKCMSEEDDADDLIPASEEWNWVALAHVEIAQSAADLERQRRAGEANIYIKTWDNRNPRGTRKTIFNSQDWCHIQAAARKKIKNCKKYWKRGVAWQGQTQEGDDEDEPGY